MNKRQIRVSFSDALMNPMEFNTIDAAIDFCRNHANHCKWVIFDGTLIALANGWFV